MSAARATPTSEDASAPVLTVLDALLEQGDKSAVKELFSKLITTYNRQLKEALLKKRDSVKNEGVSTDQLAFLFAQLQQIVGQSAEIADAKLKDAAQNEASREAKEAKKPPRQPPRRREIPAHLPVVVNPIAVPDSERACEVCGIERVCIGHDTTRIIASPLARIEPVVLAKNGPVNQRGGERRRAEQYRASRHGSQATVPVLSSMVPS